jgi:hypothetical protein
VLLRIPAESCGPRLLHRWASFAPSSLSIGHFSLHFLRPETGESPQAPLAEISKFNDLRMDESNGFLPALARARKSQPSCFVCGDREKQGCGRQPLHKCQL